MGGNKKRLLVIDDDPHIRKVVELKLKSRGFEIFLASDGEEGLEAIMTQRPDVVVSDINMPKLDGEMLCKKTNHLKKERPFLTIIVTARIASHQEKWIEDMIDTRFMEKPFSPTKLLRTIEAYFEPSEK